MANNKNIVVVETPPYVKNKIQVIDLMTDDELLIAVSERPDLVFRVITADEHQAMTHQVAGEEVKTEEVVIDERIMAEDEKKGISVRGMTLPHDLDDQISKLLGETK